MKTKEKRSDSKARSASAAVFFNDNKSIAGFGNPLRAVFTSIRELVENALDAAEKRNVTPNILLRLRRMTVDEVSNLMDMDSRKLSNKKLDFLQLSCRDNGVGVPRELIPQLFGTVLAGTKYGAQQTRGRFGLGSKMVLLYSMSTLDLPIQITTRPMGSNVTYRVKLMINLEKNKPIIISDEEIHEGDPEWFDDYGTEVKVSFTGNWGQAKNYVREYFKQLAIITPYADMHIFLPGDEPGTEDELVFKRVVDDLPKPPEVVPVHPWGTDITTFRREMALADPNDTVVEFLSKNFMGVTPQAALAFFEEVGVDPNKKPSELTEKDIRRIVHDGFQRALREAKEVKRKRDRVFKFDEPRGDALSPLGADRLRKGIEKELEPLFVEAVTRPPKAYEGHPFIIEAAIGYGGGVNKAASSKGVTVTDNKVIYRYANRIPLIFGAGNDVITQVVNSIKWNEYGLTRQSDPLAIAVSLVSTKIPFPETSKEYIDKVDEIAEEIKLALHQLGRKLKSFLSRSRRKQRERQRRSRFEKYAPKTARNLLEILARANRWDPETGVKPERLIAALSSGEPRIGRFDLPRGKSVFMEPIWMPEKWIEKLTQNEIFTVEDFLRTPNNKLAKILRKKADIIDQYKRQTILIFGEYGDIPSLPLELLVPPEVEKRFHSRDANVQLPHLSKALPRRWIRNSWDYLVTPPSLLDKVQGLLPKLIEEKKLELLYEIQSFRKNPVDENVENVLSQLENFENGQVIDYKITNEDMDTLAEIITLENEEPDLEEPQTVKLDQIMKPENFLPTEEELLAFPDIKKRKVSDYIEFLVETTHPSNPLNVDAIGSDLIKIYVEKLKLKSEEFPEILELRIDTPQPWLDGYTRNAFKRRKLAKIKDLLDSPQDIVLEIKEFQRYIYGKLIDLFLSYETPLDPFYGMSENTHEFFPFLEKLGIETLEDLATINSNELAKHPKIDPLRTKLFEQSKSQLISYLMERNKVNSLQNLKIVPAEIKSYIHENNLEDLYRFLSIIPKDEKIKELLSPYKKKYSYKLGMIGSPYQNLLKKYGIFTLEEFYYNFDTIFSFVTDSNDKEKLSDLFAILAESVHLLSEELIPNLNFLYDAGINTVGKFLIWSKEEVSRITGLSEEWVLLIEEGFKIKTITLNKKKDPLIKDCTIFNELEINALLAYGIERVGQLASILWKDYLPQSLSGSKLFKHMEINEQLYMPLEKIESFFKDDTLNKNLKSAFSKLTKKGIHNFKQIMERPNAHISSMVTGKKAKEAIDLFLYLIDHPDLEEINSDSPLFQVSQIYNAKRKLELSLVHLSEFTSPEIETLGKEGIRTIYQFYLLPMSKKEKILGISSKTIKSKLQRSTLKLHGTPIAIETQKGKFRSAFEFEVDGISHFTTVEVDSLIQAGYDTIEKLYYLTDVKTFEVYGLQWNVISQMKSLLRSPAILLSWKQKIIDEATSDEKQENEEGKTEETPEKFIYITLTADELKKLSKAKLTRVFDFLTAPSEYLSQILGWDIEKTKERQTTAILQEVGIELESLNLFRPIQIEHLKHANLLTVEDLYFSTFEESWFSDLVPWEAIATIKKLLQLPISFAEEELGEEIIETLQSSGIKTIIDFLLTGDKILEQKTSLPAERFENLKHALEFSSLVEAYDKTIFFTPNLKYFTAKKLHQAGITKILDLLSTPVSQIAKITGLSKNEIKIILANISRETVNEAEQENGIPLKDIRLFSKSEIRIISKSGVFESSDIDTLQELKFQLKSNSFIDDPLLAALIMDAQKILDLNLKYFPSIPTVQLEKLASVGIQTLSDLLFVSEEDLPETDKEIDTLVTRLTNRFIDFRPFVAMEKIPAKAISSSVIDESILDAWLNNPELLNAEALRRLPSMLLLEFNQSPFAEVIKTPQEFIGEEIVAEILIRYDPNQDTWLMPLFQKFNEVGYLINLSQISNIPITVLKLDPISFRALIKANLVSVEELILRDPYELSEKTGLSLRFFRDLKEDFSTHKYREIFEKIALPIHLIPDNEVLQHLENVGIRFLDQVLLYSSSNDEHIKRIYDFLFSGILFLSAFPGEMELALEGKSKNIIEGILYLRNQGLELDILKDIVNLGWYSWSNLAIPLQINNEWTEQNHVYSVQDLLYYVLNETVPENIMSHVSTYFDSPLFLPLNGSLLVDLVYTYRCFSIVQIFSNPLLISLLPADLRKNIKETPPKLVKEVTLGVDLFNNISSNVWRFLKKENEKITVQEIISSPRFLSNYKGIRQSILKSARDALKVPLSRIVHENGRLSHTYSSVWLDELIFLLPSLYTSDEEREKIKQIISILNGKFSLVAEPQFNEDVMSIVSTAFGEKITGFHQFWAVSWSKAKAIRNSNTEFAKFVQGIINKAFLSLSSIVEISKEEVWNFWKLGIITIADLLLTPPESLSTPYFSKRRLKEIQEYAMNFICSSDISEELPAIDVSLMEELTFIEKDGFAKLPLLYATTSHPLGRKFHSFNQIHFTLAQPIYLTKLAEVLSLEEVKSLFKLRIVSLIDLLVYNQTERLPNKLQDFSKRIKFVSENILPIKQEIQINHLSPPDKLSQFFKENELNSVTDVIEYYSINEDSFGAELIYANLRYLPFNPKTKMELKNAGIKSLMDILLIPPSKIEDIFNYSDFIEQLSLRHVSNEIEKTPLKIKELDNLSSKGIERLLSNHYISVMDIENIPKGLSKADEKILSKILDVLKLPAYVLLHLNEFNEFASFLLNIKDNTIQDIIDRLVETPEQLQEKLKQIDNEMLNSIPSNLRPLNMLEAIKAPEARKLNANGIFMFNELLKNKPIVVQILGETAYSEIERSLKAPVTNIVNLPKEILEKSKNMGITTVADLLDDPRSRNEFEDITLVIAKEIKIKDLFDSALTEALEKINVYTFSDLMENTDISGLGENGLKIVQLLNLNIGRLKSFNSQWVKQLASENIFRVWQFLTTDEGHMADILGKNVSSIRQFKESLTLKESNLNLTPNPLFNELKQFEEMLNLGIFDFQDFFGDLTPHSKSFIELKEKYLWLSQILSLPIWKYEEFWKLSKDEREKIASKSEKDATLLSLAIRNTDLIAKLLMKIINNANRIISQNFEPLQFPEEIILELQDMGILEFHQWMFEFIRGNEFTIEHKASRNYFRKSLLSTGLSSKQIRRAFKEGYSHISDILLNGIDTFTKKLRLKNPLDITYNALKSTMQLYPIGYFPRTVLQALDQSEFNDWLQLLGTIYNSDLIDVQGLTPKAIANANELFSIGIWETTVLRGLGLQKLKKLASEGIMTIGDILISKMEDILTLLSMSQEDFYKLMSSLTKATINKARKEDITRLSLSRKIKVSELETYQHHGIRSVLQIAIRAYKKPKDEKMIAGINDISRILDMPLEVAELPENVRKKAIEAGIKTIGQFLVLPDDTLKTLTGITPKQIQAFRKDIPYDASKLKKLDKKASSKKQKSSGKAKKKTTGSTPPPKEKAKQKKSDKKTTSSKKGKKGSKRSVKK